MSGSGQKATSARRCGMSVLPSEADMPVTGRFAPGAVIRREGRGGSTLRQALLILLWISGIRPFDPRGFPRCFARPTSASKIGGSGARSSSKSQAAQSSENIVPGVWRREAQGVQKK